MPGCFTLFSRISLSNFCPCVSVCVGMCSFLIRYDLYFMRHISNCVFGHLGTFGNDPHGRSGICIENVLHLLCCDTVQMMWNSFAAFFFLHFATADTFPLGAFNSSWTLCTKAIATSKKREISTSLCFATVTICRFFYIRRPMKALLHVVSFYGNIQ